MKNVFKIFLIAIIFSTVLFSQNCKSKVTINSEADDLLIFVDNVYKGNGKIEIDLSNGIHIVKIKEPGLNWDARTLQKEINITDCNENYNFTFPFEATILFETKPLDVWVYENNALLGNTPLLISKNVEAIKLEKKDYKTLTLKTSELASLNPVKLEFTGETKSTSFADSPYFKILIGTAVGLGGLAAYYKIQADQSFEKYELTNQQKYLDETDKFDNMSGIAFGVRQVNFGALIYFLLSDQ